MSLEESAWQLSRADSEYTPPLPRPAFHGGNNSAPQRLFSHRRSPRQQPQCTGEGSARWRVRGPRDCWGPCSSRLQTQAANRVAGLPSGQPCHCTQGSHGRAFRRLSTPVSQELKHLGAPPPAPAHRPPASWSPRPCEDLLPPGASPRGLPWPRRRLPSDGVYWAPWLTFASLCLCDFGGGPPPAPRVHTGHT